MYMHTHVTVDIPIETKLIHISCDNNAYVIRTKVLSNSYNFSSTYTCKKHNCVASYLQ